MRSVDVLIVGGGLSGTICARELSDLDPSLEVVTIDRLSDERYDRYHRICGEALSERSLRLCGLGPRNVRNRIEKARETWPGGIVIEERASGYIIDRPAFLRSLQEEVSGSVDMVKASMRSVEREGAGFMTRTDQGPIRSRWLVGADGAFSGVRRSLGGGRPREVIAVKQFLVDEPAEEGVISFEYGGRYRGGYRWRFPCGDMSNIGFPHGTDSRPGRIVEENARYIPIGAVDPVPCPGACLLGDAAGMVNPLSFGGIGVAMLSARKAAQSIVSGGLEGYRGWWRGSGYSRSIFWDAYEASKHWDDERMADFMGPFRDGYGVMPLLRSMVRGSEERMVTRAFLASFKDGW